MLRTAKLLLMALAITASATVHAGEKGLPKDSILGMRTPGLFEFCDPADVVGVRITYDQDREGICTEFTYVACSDGRVTTNRNRVDGYFCQNWRTPRLPYDADADQVR